MITFANFCAFKNDFSYDIIRLSKYVNGIGQKLGAFFIG
jgi:hypothetical protein